MRLLSARHDRKGTLKRVLLLIAFLACELLAVYSLRSRGWTATGDSIHLIFAAAIALLPFVAAIVVLLFRGRRFSLRSMLISTALFAIFIAIILIPYTQVRNRRRGIMRLDATRIEYGTEYSVSDVYERLHIPYRYEPVSATRTSGDITFWMRPLLGESFPTYPDRAVRRLKFLIDEDVENVAPYLDAFPNLEHVSMRGPENGMAGVSENGMRFCAEHYSTVESLSVHLSTVLYGWEKPLPGVRILSIDNYQTPATGRPTDKLFRDISAIPKLSVLRLSSISINEEQAAILSKAPELVHLTLWGPEMTPAIHAALRKENPNLQLMFGPNQTSPNRFAWWAEDSEVAYRVTYNEQRAEWGWKRLPNSPDFEEFGDGSALIDDAYPVTLKIQAPKDAVDSFIRNSLRSLRNRVKRTGWIESSVEESEHSATITFVKDRGGVIQ